MGGYKYGKQVGGGSGIDAVARNEVSSVKRSYKDMKPSFCFTDDDISAKVVTVLKPILDARGIKPTLAVITGMLGTSGKLTESQIKGLYNEGWGMASHTHNHITLDGVALTTEDIEFELSTSKAHLEGLGIKCDTLIYPEGKYNKKVVDIAKKYYKCALRTGLVTGVYPISTYGVERLSIGAFGITDFPTVQATIDTIIEKKQLCIVSTHIGPNTAADNLLIEQTVDYIIGLGYEFKTFNDAYENHKNIIEHGEYTDATDQVEFAVAVEGSLGGTGAGHTKRLPANTVSSATLPKEYPLNKITYCRISDSNKAGFPAGTQGVVTTNTLGYSSASFNIWQDFQGVLNNSVYRRYAINSTTWDVWQQLNTGVTVADNTILNATLPNALPANIVSYSRISTANSTGLPVSGNGLLTSNTLGVTGFTYNVFQEYRPSAKNTVFRRTALSSTTWGAWEQVMSKVRYTYAMNSVVPANSILTVDTTTTGLSDSDNVIAMPQFGLTTGIMPYPYIDGAGLVKIRLFNATGADVTVNKTWLIDVYKQ
ncbi:polysaccharide deacetylase family protein [Peribacillus butanolivorans]|uniref:NodB homology domain-containing protein n=1 Tax=Peribacillus butanolivorans TaxID=421767 RepID=A0ABN5N558_9BACI|nr:polysaccharide deacetylase family protein [Peribacillus butanolivorans]AXN39845.1 hypothetical protein DTO10_16750 [Peribacillus butanolivorans]